MGKEKMNLTWILVSEFEFEKWQGDRLDPAIKSRQMLLS